MEGSNLMRALHGLIGEKREKQGIQSPVICVGPEESLHPPFYPGAGHVVSHNRQFGVRPQAPSIA